MIMINDASQNFALAFHLMFIVKKVQKMRKSISYSKIEYLQKFLRERIFLKHFTAILLYNAAASLIKRIISEINISWTNQSKLAVKYCLKIDLNSFKVPRATTFKIWPIYYN